MTSSTFIEFLESFHLEILSNEKRKKKKGITIDNPNIKDLPKFESA